MTFGKIREFERDLCQKNRAMRRKALKERIFEAFICRLPAVGVIVAIVLALGCWAIMVYASTLGLAGLSSLMGHIMR